MTFSNSCRNAHWQAALASNDFELSCCCASPGTSRAAPPDTKRVQDPAGLRVAHEPMLMKQCYGIHAADRVASWLHEAVSI